MLECITFWRPDVGYVQALPVVPSHGRGRGRMPSCDGTRNPQSPSASFVLCGMARHGMAWHGVAWRGVAARCSARSLAPQGMSYLAAMLLVTGMDECAPAPALRHRFRLRPTACTARRCTVTRHSLLHTILCPSGRYETFVCLANMLSQHFFLDFFRADRSHVYQHFSIYNQASV